MLPGTISMILFGLINLYEWKINPFLGYLNADNNNLGLNNVKLHLQWTKHAFKVGNSVEITFGAHKGIFSGMLVTVTDEMVTVMTTNFVDVSYRPSFDAIIC